MVQRTDGALRLNVHLHVLALDGVYVRDESARLEFHPLTTPSRAEVEDVARRTARRLHRVFRKEGRHSPWDEPELSEQEHPFTVEQPGLFACYQAAALGVGVSGERAGQPTLRLLAGEGKLPHVADDEVVAHRSRITGPMGSYSRRPRCCHYLPGGIGTGHTGCRYPGRSSSRG